MPRTTKINLDHRAEVVSRMLNGLRIDVEGRNGYTALELCDAFGVVKTLKIGTKTECYDHLAAMIQALEIVNRSSNES
jgi:hypothetical protein